MQQESEVQRLLQHLVRKQGKWVPLQELCGSSSLTVNDIHALWVLQRDYEGVFVYMTVTSISTLFSLDDNGETIEPPASGDSFVPVNLILEALRRWVATETTLPVKLNAVADSTSGNTWFHVVMSKLDIPTLSKIWDLCGAKKCLQFSKITNIANVSAYDVAAKDTRMFFKQKVLESIDSYKASLKSEITQLSQDLQTISSRVKEMSAELDEFKTCDFLKSPGFWQQWGPVVIASVVAVLVRAVLL